MDRAKELLTKREAIEEELRELGKVLTANHIGMEEPLVDNEGFPRADVDVYAVRHARAKIIPLRNDLKQVTDDIEKVLHELHAEARTSKQFEPASMESEEEAQEKAAAEAASKVFARVASVEYNSPAAAALLMVDDLVVRFGTVNQGNHRELKAVAEVVGASVGKPIRVVVLRKTTGTSGRLMDLNLTPSNSWGGRGLLGCRIVASS